MRFSRSGCVGKVTVQACWDVSRLDLDRVGIRPNTSKLCTEAARCPDLLGGGLPSVAATCERISLLRQLGASSASKPSRIRRSSAVGVDTPPPETVALSHARVRHLIVLCAGGLLKHHLPLLLSFSSAAKKLRRAALRVLLLVV